MGAGRQPRYGIAERMSLYPIPPPPIPILVLALCNALMGLAYSLLLNQAAISTKQLQLFRPQLTH